MDSPNSLLRSLSYLVLETDKILDKINSISPIYVSIPEAEIDYPSYISHYKSLGLIKNKLGTVHFMLKAYRN